MTQLTKEHFEQQLGKLATKDDLKKLVSKDDLTGQMPPELQLPLRVSELANLKRPNLDW